MCGIFRKSLIIAILILLFSINVYAQQHGSVTATVNADTGIYTTSIGASYRGSATPVNISIYGASAWVATLNVERRFGSTGTWMVVKQYSASDAISNSIQEQIFDSEPGSQYRIGCASGNYTSGTISVRLSK